ncbi:MAG: hypothetical protein H0T89_10020 [Deltaproteobacteria bacterium]|nr:hypothetical protein [Deltaproteobacteria bacterium]MDQ3296051.1 PEP-utilizing enzyme [Myxococcota bacterium]
MWVRPLAESDASCGGKAVGLARLIAAGLPVPDGFVIDDRAFRFVVGELPVDDPAALGHALEVAASRIAIEELPPAVLVEEVTRRASELGTLAIRSSATLEDGVAGAAAGVFSSVTGVPLRRVWSAVRAVWTSALTPLAASYARRRAGTLAVGVIVQRFIAGDRITIYTRPPGEPRGREIWVQRGEHVRTYGRDEVDPLVALALRAEHAIAAIDGADVELVETRTGEPWIVQARPIAHPAPPSRTPPPPIILEPLVADGRRWTWDVAHNPDPLSLAQVGLVERVERAAIAPWSLRVCGGYLYSAPRGEPQSVTVRDRTDLEARAAVIETAIERILDVAAPSLDVALERYLAFYERWASEAVPLIAAARAGLRPEQLAGARPSAVEATIFAAARDELDAEAAIAKLGLRSVAWDVAVPTFGEQPALIRDAIARARSITPPRAAPEPVDAAAQLARAAADLAERDDAWFARAQAMVRAALQRRAVQLAIDEADIYWLPLDEVMTADTLDRDDAHRRAAAARAAADRARKWAMPLTINEAATKVADSGPVLHGQGTGTSVSGRVVRFASLASAVTVGSGDIAVTLAITPALAVFVVGCAAIVSETGGPLDHGAALARELGIPCVVGCRDAMSLLRDGMIVTVDGVAGRVTINEPA